MINVDCADCAGAACTTEDIDSTPQSCPRRVTQQAIGQAEEIRNEDAEVKRCAQVAAEVEKTAYRQWPRVRELVEFCQRMGISHLGVAFCVGLRQARYWGLCKVAIQVFLTCIVVNCKRMVGLLEASCGPPRPALCLADGIGR